MNVDRDAAGRITSVIADRLADPGEVRFLELAQGWWPQSLAHGAVGVALLHIERAHSGVGSWRRAHNWLDWVAREPAVAGTDCHPFYGAPALAYALDMAAGRTRRYASALSVLDKHLQIIIQERLDHAHQRMAQGRDLPALAEFDAIRGMAGFGALLQRRGIHPELLEDVLTYLVRLTEPVTIDGEVLPGWWSHQAPSGKVTSAFSEGHANNGVAHGISGPLAVLARTARCGITVDGQDEAIRRICTWLDKWRQDAPSGPWWPYWVTRDQLHAERAGLGPSRPSWCYGTAGVARVQQITGQALGDPVRQQAAEDALIKAMTDPQQLEAITDASLCHGFAGLAHIIQIAATESLAPDMTDCLPALLKPFTDVDPDEIVGRLLTPAAGTADIGLLEGAAGIALALHGIAIGVPAASGWNICFLIN